MLSSKMKVFLTVLVVLLFLVGGGTWYMAKVKPLLGQVVALETEVAAEKHLIELYESGKEVETTEEKAETLALQKKVPVVENMEQFLLLLEEAEVVSDSLIRNISFSQSNEEVPEENTTEEDLAMIEKRNEQLAKAGEEQTGSAEPALPSGLQKITANLTIEADDYFELEAFVREIEQFERITNVENLQFSGFQEVTRVDGSLEELPLLTYSMTVSTYYLPTLEQLKDEAPKYEPKEPAQKENPLFQSETPKKQSSPPSVEQKQYKEVEKNGVRYQVYTYHVKKGDTLFELSIDYYNSRVGEALMRSWNNIKQLETGMTIEIPVPINQ